MIISNQTVMALRQIRGAAYHLLKKSSRRLIFVAWTKKRQLSFGD
jgi:hypothetical protein